MSEQPLKGAGTIGLGAGTAGASTTSPGGEGGAGIPFPMMNGGIIVGDVDCVHEWRVIPDFFRKKHLKSERIYTFYCVRCLKSKTAMMQN